MKIMFLRALLLCSLSCMANAADQGENPAPAEPTDPLSSSKPTIDSGSKADNTTFSTPASPVARFFGKIDTLELSYGAANLELRNPEGFDVATEVYDDGEAPEDFLSFGLPRVTLSAYSAYGTTPSIRRRFALSYDREDYKGLWLRAVTADAGLVAETGERQSRLNIGMSIGTGLTQSESFNDRAYHPIVQASVHMRLSLYRVFLEFVALERLNLSATLDGRSAQPRVRSSTVMLGYRFK